MTQEIWQPIPLWEDRYEASNTGKIRSVPNLRSRPHPFCEGSIQTRVYGGKVLSPKTGRGGYQYVNLCIGTKGHMRAVHRLVMAAFAGKSTLDVNHKNGIKKDNALSNLEYMTRRDNIYHAINELGVIPCWELNRRKAQARKLAKEIA